MAMYFVGANYGGEDMSSDFIKEGGIFLGYLEHNAQPLYALLNEITTGDIVAIKAYSPSNGLYIKGLGICASSELITNVKLNKGKQVHWLWSGNLSLGVFKDSYTNMRTGSLYIERNEEILKSVLKLLKETINN